MVSFLGAVLMAVSLCGCKWFKSGDESSPGDPVEKNLHNTAELARYLDSGKGGWDRYLTVNSTLQRNQERFHVTAFLRQGTGIREMQSVLVLSRKKVQARANPLVAELRLSGTLNEIHLIRLGPDPSTHLVFTTGTEYNNNKILIDSSYWDVRQDKEGKWNFHNVWQVLHEYDPRVPGSYRPPDFHYWDVDDDGVQEIIVTNPWKGSAPPWRLRWAVFQWNEDLRRPVPLRGLGLFPFREQEPSWLVWSVMEMMGMGHDEDVVRFFSTSPACESAPVLLHALGYFPGTLRGHPVLHEVEQNRVVLSVNRVNRKKETMQYRFELRRMNHPVISSWRICRVNLFSVRKEEYPVF